MAARRKRLHGRRGGEPFMINPRLGILTGNPRRKRKTTRKKSVLNSQKRGKAMARRSSKAHMAYVRSFKKNAKRRRRTVNVHHRRARRRRNPYPVAGVALNPRRRHRRRNPVARHHRRRGRRNPSVTKILGVELPPMQAVLWAGVGFVAPSSVETWLNANVTGSLATTTVGKYAVRIASVLGVSWIVKSIMGPSEGRMAGIGGGAYVLISALKEFAPAGSIPGLNAYVAPGAPGLSAYVAPTRMLSAGGIPAFGASRVVSGRFKRF
jgi:hypothetical protein